MADNLADSGARPKKSDLGVRAASAAVMMAIALAALWLGGVWLDAFIIAVAGLTFAELALLVRRLDSSTAATVAWLVFGALYVGAAAYFLVQVNDRVVLALIVGIVILCDTFAYAFGRTIGGPKIAPRISPNKTWAGLLGGIVGATLALVLFYLFGTATHNVVRWPLAEYAALILPGAALAVLAQAGDFFESWLKRRAGAKDSSDLIPGHGGVFDRTDGIIPVAIAVGIMLQLLYPNWLG